MNNSNQDSKQKTLFGQGNVINILKLNYWLFSWYYKKVPEHFKSWTFIKSVKLLIQNYEHKNILFQNELKHNQALINTNDKLRKDITQLRIKQVANDTHIRNKLSPIKNLITMFENGLVKGTIEVHPLIIAEIEQCKESILYIKQQV